MKEAHLRVGDVEELDVEEVSDVGSLHSSALGPVLPVSADFQTTLCTNDVYFYGYLIFDMNSSDLENIDIYYF